MTNISDAFRVEGLSINDTVIITQGSFDPSTVPGQAAPQGSLFLRTNGEAWMKTGTLDVEWSRTLDSSLIGTPGGIASLDATGNVPLNQLNNVPGSGSSLTPFKLIRTNGTIPTSGTYQYLDLDISHTDFGSGQGYTVPANSRIRVPQAGIYELHASLAVSNLPAGNIKYILAAYLNGNTSNHRYLTRGLTSATGYWGVSGAITLELSALDTFDLRVFMARNDNSPLPSALNIVQYDMTLKLV